MSAPHTADVFIAGAGPAGLCAALRLHQLGYSIVLAERSALWPRPQIGEAFTPGIKNIVELLDANDALENVPHLARRPACVRWRSAEPELVTHGDSAVVERAAFDAALLNLAAERGVEVLRPARLLGAEGGAGGWKLLLESEAGRRQIRARFILDASGRGAFAAMTLPCAPRLAAIWAECAAPDVPPHMADQTRVEAQEHGWLWGARLPGGSYRMMLLSDPAFQHRLMPGRPEAWLRAQCASSKLFDAIAASPFSGRVQACSATPYLACDSWQEGRLKIGDAAFAIDPVSSSGVEKAMRFSLQAAVAVHTVLQSDDAQAQALARDFFRQRLVETCARHGAWTQSYYRQAWCGSAEFWQARGKEAVVLPENADFTMRTWHAELQENIERLELYRPPALRTFAPDWERRVRFAADVRIVQAPCVVDDRVRSAPALTHPNLERPLAYLEDEALLPLLNMVQERPTLKGVRDALARAMDPLKAQRLLGWLWQHGLLEHAGQEDAGAVTARVRSAQSAGNPGF